MGIIKIKAEFTENILNYYDSMDTKILYDGKSFNNMYMTSFLQYVIDQGESLYPVLVNGGWLEIDTVNDLIIYNDLFNANKLSIYYDC